jgi:hypothetical protein
MPKNEPNAQTRATEKYHKKAGYRNVTFKLKGDIPDRFAEACAAAGRSKASVVTELMQEFIDRQREEHGKG